MACDRKIGPFDCCSVVQGDCLELMKQLPDGCVDAVITDPPYGIGFAYDGVYHDNPAAYSGLIERVLPEAERISVSGSYQAYFQSAKTAPKWSELFKRDYRPVAIPKNFVQWSVQHIQWSTDYVLVWSKGEIEHWEVNITPRDWYLSASASITSPSHPLNNRCGHPCPRPLDAMLWLTELLSRPDSTVFDPFMGSGSTGMAAKKLGRHFLGFEISEAYCQIARERLARIDAQPSLFEKKPEQLSL